MGVGFRSANEDKQEDVRKGERAAVATAHSGLNKARKGGRAQNSLGSKGGIFINCPKYSLVSAAQTLPHFHPTSGFTVTD